MGHSARDYTIRYAARQVHIRRQRDLRAPNGFRHGRDCGANGRARSAADDTHLEKATRRAAIGALSLRVDAPKRACIVAGLAHGVTMGCALRLAIIAWERQRASRRNPFGTLGAPNEGFGAVP